MEKQDDDMAVFRQAVNIFGRRSQMLKAAEECNELSRALIRHLNNLDNVEAVKSEMADVVIMLHQLGIILGGIDDAYDLKVNRLREHLNELRSL